MPKPFYIPLLPDFELKILGKRAETEEEQKLIHKAAVKELYETINKLNEFYNANKTIA